MRKKKNIDIESIDVMFENLYLMSFGKEALEFFYAEDISSNITMILNGTIKSNVAKKLAFGIRAKEANKEISIFGLFKPEWKVKFAEEVKTNPIAFIEINYNNGTSERVYAPWEGDDDFHNPAQKVTTDEDGTVFVEIARKEG